jgi:hypothetical protein
MVQPFRRLTGLIGASQELRRILYKNVLSAEAAAMHRSGSAPAGIDGMMQRHADVEYDQRSRFGSLGASPSDTFLQEACYNNRSAACGSARAAVDPWQPLPLALPGSAAAAAAAAAADPGPGARRDDASLASFLQGPRHSGAGQQPSAGSGIQAFWPQEGSSHGVAAPFGSSKVR